MAHLAFGLTIHQYRRVDLIELLADANIHTELVDSKEILFSRLQDVSSNLDALDTDPLTRAVRTQYRSRIYWISSPKEEAGRAAIAYYNARDVAKSLFRSAVSAKSRRESISHNLETESSAIGHSSGRDGKDTRGHVSTRRRVRFVTPAHEPSPPVTRNCAICLEDLPENRFPNERITRNCNHDSRYCLECLEDSITSSFENSFENAAKCFHRNCEAILSTNEVRKWCSSANFERLANHLSLHKIVANYDRYCAKATSLLLRNDPTFQVCLQPSCGSGQYHNDAENALMVCHLCKRNTYTRHQMPFHEGMTSDQYDTREELYLLHQQQEEASEQAKERMARPCPNCYIVTEKAPGCKHMTCRK